MVLEIIFLAISVAMDAFAVAICKGIVIKNDVNKKAAVIGLWFGFFQGLMPLVGFFAMNSINDYLDGVKEYIIFGLLSFVGVSMIFESFDKNEKLDGSTDFKIMLCLSIATSLDALSLGMTLSLMNASIFTAVLIISIITFSFCFVGVNLGNKVGMKYKAKAEIVGGVILIVMGIKTIVEYLL